MRLATISTRVADAASTKILSRLAAPPSSRQRPVAAGQRDDRFAGIYSTPRYRACACCPSSHPGQASSRNQRASTAQPEPIASTAQRWQSTLTGAAPREPAKNRNDRSRQSTADARAGVIARSAISDRQPYLPEGNWQLTVSPPGKRPARPVGPHRCRSPPPSKLRAKRTTAMWWSETSDMAAVNERRHAAARSGQERRRRSTPGDARLAGTAQHSPSRPTGPGRTRQGVVAKRSNDSRTETGPHQTEVRFAATHRLAGEPDATGGGSSKGLKPWMSAGIAGSWRPPARRRASGQPSGAPRRGARSRTSALARSLAARGSAKALPRP